MLNWAAEYHTLVVSKLPGAQGGVIDREGNVLFTTDPAITSAVANQAQLANIVDKGARIFVAVDIKGQNYNLNSGEEFGDGVAALVPMSGGQGGGLIAVPAGHAIVAFELHSIWTKVMQDAVRSINERLPQDC